MYVYKKKRPTYIQMHITCILFMCVVACFLLFYILSLFLAIDAYIRVFVCVLWRLTSMIPVGTKMERQKKLIFGHKDCISLLSFIFLFSLFSCSFVVVFMNKRIFFVAVVVGFEKSSVRFYFFCIPSIAHLACYESFRCKCTIKPWKSPKSRHHHEMYVRIINYRMIAFRKNSDRN